MGDDPKCRGMRTLFFFVVQHKKINKIIQGPADWIDLEMPSNELVPSLSHFTALSVRRGT